MAHCSKTTKHKVDDETRCFSSNWAETFFCGMDICKFIDKEYEIINFNNLISIY